VQFGVFSPIMRLHSTNNPCHERRPWGYDANTLQATRAALQLRHALIPYLYTMVWRNSTGGRSLARPLYHGYPPLEEAYHCPDEYTFGSELLAAPYIVPAGKDTRLSRQVVWLPPGDWFAFEDGRRFPGDRWHAIYGDLNHIPLFARAGAIVPLGPRAGWGGVGNPAALEIYLFPGASNEFALYEDDGSHEAHEQGNFALTPMALSWEPAALSFTLGPVRHEQQLVPAGRTVTVHVRGVSHPENVSLAVNGEPEPAAFTFDEATATLSLPAVTLGPDDRLTLHVSGQSLLSGEDYRRETVRRMVEHFHLQTTAKSAILSRLDQILDDPAALLPYGAALRPAHWRALLEVITGAGSHYIDHLDSPPELVLWNNDERADVRYRLAAMKRHLWSAEGVFSGEAGPLPRFRALVPGEAFPASKWELSVRYGDLHEVHYAADPGRAEDAD
jgi:hypothetical protein